MPAFLVPLAGGKAVPLDKAIMLIGRGAECDLTLKGSQKISRRHCCIAQVNDYYVIRDLGSMNGIRVNDKPVRESKVKPGDRLTIGDIDFELDVQQSIVMKPKQPAPRPVAEDNGPPLPRPYRKPRVPSPAELSQDIPIAIPESLDDLPVDESLQQTPPRETPQFPSKRKADRGSDELEMSDSNVR